MAPRESVSFRNGQKKEQSLFQNGQKGQNDQTALLKCRVVFLLLSDNMFVLHNTMKKQKVLFRLHKLYLIIIILAIEYKSNGIMIR